MQCISKAAADIVCCIEVELIETEIYIAQS